MRRKTTAGKPGIAAKMSMIAAPTASARGCALTSLPISLPRSVPPSSDETRVTMKPAVMEVKSAGICPTSPSPIVRME